MLIKMLLISTAMLYQRAQSTQSDSSVFKYVHRSLIPHIQRMIRVQVQNEDKMETFPINPDATTADLYRTAESIGIMDPRNNTVLWEYECSGGVFISDDPSIRCQDILTPTPNHQRSKLPKQIHLHVFAAKQIEITVHITNGNNTESILCNPLTRTSEIYQKAVDIGIMDNYHQFLLQYQNDENRVLVNDANPTTPPQTLLNSMDLRSPSDLRLIVSPIPEGVLLFSMFRDMAPNQDIPFWDYAEFCYRNPWNEYCSNLCFIKDRDDKAIHAVNVPTWSGILHLEHIPRSVHSMILKGRSVTVNLGALRFSSLIELVLDFEDISGLKIVALSGSSLEMLRLPAHSAPAEKNIESSGVLKILSDLRAQRKISLQLIDFGAATTNQKVIWYDSNSREYKYIRVDPGCRT